MWTGCGCRIVNLRWESRRGVVFMTRRRTSPYLTQKEMVEILSVSRATVQRLIKRLDDERKLERVGGKRYGYWVIHE